MKKNERLEIAIRAAVDAGNSLLDYFSDKVKLSGTQKESLRDIVTDADIRAEKIVLKVIQDSDDSPILSEETGVVGQLHQKGSYWVVDPLDGTVNFTHGLPFYATSVAYLENGVPKIGVVYNPSQNELFYAARGVGAYKNQKRIEIHDRSHEHSLFAIAFSGKKNGGIERMKEFEMFQKINDNSMGCLRTGSAALNLAYLAEGRFGGCVGNYNKIWDVAAGFVLAEVAGATVKTNYSSHESNKVSYVVAAPSSVDFLERVVNS